MNFSRRPSPPGRTTCWKALICGLCVAGRALAAPGALPPADPPASAAGLHPGWVAIGSGTMALIDGTTLLARPCPRPSHSDHWSRGPAESNAELVTGWSLGAMGMAAVGSGLLEMLRPDLWPF